MPMSGKPKKETSGKGMPRKRAERDVPERGGPRPQGASGPKAPGRRGQDSEKAGRSAQERKAPGRGGQDSKKAGWDARDRKTPGRGEQAPKKSGWSAQDRKTPGKGGQDSQKSGWDARERKAPGRGGQDSQKSGWDARDRKAPGRGGHAPQKAGRDIQDRKTSGKREPQKLCPVASKCGSCQWINKGYGEQLEAKATKFRRLMEPYCRPEHIIPMDDPNHYRNKVHAAFGEDARHRAVSGTYEEKSHRIVPIDSCLIENQKADEIIVSIRGLLKSFKIRPYDEDTGRGLLRHVLIRVGHATGQIMVVLVLGYPIMPSKNNFVKALLKIHPEITTMVLNINDKDTSMVLGDREQVIYGKGYIEDELCGMTFRISPKSFYQVNPVQTEKLYAKAMEYAGLTGEETVMDAYCGTGTIGLIAGRQADNVLGVELNRDAVRDAVSNARRNKISNVRFYQRDAGEFLLEMAEAGGKLDVLFMDPPRSGSSEAFLNAAAKIRPRRIVYISCNPETLVADLRILVKKGYKGEKCVAVDMFPYTDAIEAVVALSL